MIDITTAHLTLPSPPGYDDVRKLSHSAGRAERVFRGDFFALQSLSPPWT